MTASTAAGTANHGTSRPRERKERRRRRELEPVDAELMSCDASIQRDANRGRRCRAARRPTATSSAAPSSESCARAPSPARSASIAPAPKIRIGYVERQDQQRKQTRRRRAARASARRRWRPAATASAYLATGPRASTTISLPSQPELQRRAAARATASGSARGRASAPSILPEISAGSGCGDRAICSRVPSAKSVANRRGSDSSDASSAATHSTPGPSARSGPGSASDAKREQRDDDYVEQKLRRPTPPLVRKASLRSRARRPADVRARRCGQQAARAAWLRSCLGLLEPIAATPASRVGLRIRAAPSASRLNFTRRAHASASERLAPAGDWRVHGGWRSAPFRRVPGAHRRRSARHRRAGRIERRHRLVEHPQGPGHQPQPGKPDASSLSLRQHARGGGAGATAPRPPTRPRTALASALIPCSVTSDARFSSTVSSSFQARRVADEDRGCSQRRGRTG